MNFHPGLRIAQWSAPKLESTPLQNEDATAIVWNEDSRTLGVAVADGATESVFAREWAHRLVQEARPGWSLLSDEELGAALAPVRAGFRPLDGLEKVSWFVRAKVESQGSQSTLLVMRLEPTESPGDWILHVIAIGDSCLVLLRAGGEALGFPIEHSSGFGRDPRLVTSLDRPVEARRWSTRVAAGDVLLAGTDAIAQWALACVESKFPVKILEVIEKLTGPTNEEEPEECETLPSDRWRCFEEILVTLRTEGAEPRLRNDDSTLVVCRILEVPREGADPDPAVLAAVSGGGSDVGS